MGVTIRPALYINGAGVARGALLPPSNDGAALGSASQSWSDLFLASGGVINWNNGDVTLTHSADKLALAGGMFEIPDGTPAAPGLIFAGGSGNDGLYLNDANTVGIAAGGVQQALFTTGGTFYLGPGTDLGIGRVGAGVLQFFNGTGFTALLRGASGGATSVYSLQKKVTGIADNTATDVFTVTVPNANHAAAIRITFLSSNGSTDAFESSRVAVGTVVLARTSGVDTVATAVALDNAGIATVGGGATHTLAYGVTAMTGAASATQTFTIQVTIDDSGNLGSNQVVAVAELLNAEASGVTIA